MELHEQQALMESLNIKVIELDLLLRHVEGKIDEREMEANTQVLSDRDKTELQGWYETRADYKAQLLGYQQRMMGLDLDIRKATIQKLLKR